MQLTCLDDIAGPYDAVYVSPHFDDAAASCGGRIIDEVSRGRRVLVATVFTGGPASQRRSRKPNCRFGADYRQRRLEDTAAMQILGCDFIWLGYKEAVFRSSIPLFRYWPTYRSSTSNAALVRAIFSDLLNLCRRSDCQSVLLPLAVGQHMDHQLVFEAGIELLRSAEFPSHILFYEDCPYVLFPQMLTYRMKIIGGYRHLPKGMRCSLKTTLPSIRRDAVDLLSGPPGASMNGLLSRRLRVMLIALFGLYASRILKTGPNRLNGRRCLRHVLQDISRTMERKLDAITAYQSQLDRPVLERSRIQNALAAYAAWAGMPENRYCERYWTVASI